MSRTSVNARTLRVFVAGWVIQDGSFPRSTVGDVVDVILEHHSSADGSISPIDDTRQAIARPAYGSAPRPDPDGRSTWLHLVYGDGWSSQWWTDRPTNGPVTLTGVFSAVLENLHALDRPPRVHGRIRRMHMVDIQVRPSGNGWEGVDDTHRLTEVDSHPHDLDFWPSEHTREGDYVNSGILVELDLDDVQQSPTTFDAGAVSVHGDTVWVMHASDPILLRVDTATSRITRYLLPLTIEPGDDRWTRRVHAVEDGCWTTSKHDVHRCTVDPDGTLSVDRYCTTGASGSALIDGKLYLVGESGSSMSCDRRHGIIRTSPDQPRIRLLDQQSRRIVPAPDSPKIPFRRADRATAPDGIEWRVEGADVLQRIDFSANSSSTIDLPGAAVDGTVRCTTPNPFDDPENAEILARITVDGSWFVKSPES